ncbi:MAG: alanine racemase [Clostridiales bacterium]|nr:alanine racemase [Clostridiales bacterium]
MLRNTQTHIDLSAIEHNIGAARAHLDAGTKIMAVVKAEAYGHGLVPVSQYLETRGLAECLGIAIVEEGVTLREAGVQLPVLVMGAADAPHMREAIAQNLALTVFDVESLAQAAAYATQMNKAAYIHIKIDTGMNRIGIRDAQTFNAILAQFRACPLLRFAGLFTHFAKSESDPEFTLAQAERFEKFARRAKHAGFSPLLHAANSGGVFTERPGLRFDMARQGISLYGYHPDPAQTEKYVLAPALSWHTRVAQIKTVPTGEGIGYGLRHVTARDTVVATLPVGYGDGYKRCLSGKSEVLIRGRRAPVLGTVCMDMIMADVTDIPGVQTDDAVVLLGEQGTERITADELAALADTISYEILLSISARVPRVYL